MANAVSSNLIVLWMYGFKSRSLHAAAERLQYNGMCLQPEDRLASDTSALRACGSESRHAEQVLKTGKTRK